MGQSRSANVSALRLSQVDPWWWAWLGVALASSALFLPLLAENAARLADAPPEARQALREANVTAGFHAGYHTVLDVAFAVAGLALSALVLRRHASEPLAVYAALVLAAWAPLNGLAVESPLGGPWWGGAAVAGAWAAWAWLLAISTLTYRRSPVLRTRQQVRWLWYGAATSLSASVIIVGAIGTGATLGARDVDRHMTGHLLLVMAQSCLLASVAAAWVLRSAPDPDTLIRRTVVYAILSALGAAASIALVVLPAILYFELGVIYFVALVSVWAIFGVPVQQFVQRSVNRMMYGRRDEPMAVLQSLGERLELGAPETVLNTIVETVAATLKLPRVEIRPVNGGPPLSAVGSSDLEPVALPITHQGERLAELVAWPRARDEALQPQDHEVLRLIARQAAPTVRAVQLNQELRRSRQEILSGREEERRRIRRDLHDGLGPALAAIAMQADTARALVEDDPAATRELLAAVTQQSEEIVQEVRRLVYDLRPPALDDLGLHGAIDRLARQHSSATLEVVVASSPTLPRASAAVEVAVYRIVAEALTNVVRHSRARRCEIVLGGMAPAGTRAFLVTIEDDGIGMLESAARGIGLRSMRERAEEVGGEISFVARAGGGTRVQLAVPASVWEGGNP